eukprot:CAMPEP_0196826750 /NCGR_PEP_ID=MMETSP1362-20130617/93785_1 /TAXON_ID=163516 /ORGANISM="Leptocylindrus danicus, Strain CCMP1856" /LENGTH=380 /DNA_ID=CAMNT_0042207337 /DNA_START=142 /DNA_END=1284 /DNA_ORIENTATION=+
MRRSRRRPTTSTTRQNTTVIFVSLLFFLTTTKTTSAYRNRVVSAVVGRSDKSYPTSRSNSGAIALSNAREFGDYCQEHGHSIIGLNFEDVDSCDDYSFSKRYQNQESNSRVEMVGRKTTITLNLLRGSFLRIASDLTGGIPLENIKSRVATTTEGPVAALNHILKERGVLGLWNGTPSRTVDGALMGAIFLAGSTATKNQVLRMGGSKTVAALCGGVVGGVAQAFVMTPGGLIFTGVNNDPDRNSAQIILKIYREKGILGLFAGFDAMALRQATNWASRSTFTEIARTNLRMSQYGLLGEIGSGIIGGVGSTWNTPIETLRVRKQRDASLGIEPKSYGEYIDEAKQSGGYIELFRGITPRTVQAVWQTVFMVVVPNILGL